MIYRVVPTFRMKIAAIDLLHNQVAIKDLTMLQAFRRYTYGSEPMNAQLDRIGSYLYGAEVWALYAAGYEVNTSLKG